MGIFDKNNAFTGTVKKAVTQQPNNAFTGILKKKLQEMSALMMPQFQMPTIIFPDIPAPPPPPDFASIFAAEREKLQRGIRAGRGRGATILTSVMGDTSDAPISKKKLLGA